MELEVNMYVRTNNGEIGQIEELNHQEGALHSVELNNGSFLLKDNYFKKASHNIIDLIEVGDYVNGYKVSFKGNDYKPFVQCDYPVQEGTTNHYRFYEEAIYSIVTKEQFEAMQYKVV